MYLDSLFKGAPHINIEQLSCDSRTPMKDAIYFCIEGIKYNGHDFIDEAINNGAGVIVYSENIDINRNAVFVKVNDVLDVLNKCAAKFYDYPSKSMDTFITTGCYGKKEVSNIIYQLNSRFESTGSIGVNGINYSNTNLLSMAETLQIIDNQRYLRTMLDNNVKTCLFEASVLSLSYKKLNAVNPRAVIYTATGYNTTNYRELNKDYEPSLLYYLNSLGENTLLILNKDDSLFDFVVSNTSNRYYSYGFSDGSDFYIDEARYYIDHTEIKLKYHNQTFEFTTSLLGENNVYYLVAAIAALSLKHPLLDIIGYIPDIKCHPGCMELLNTGEPFNVLVDEAYEYEALEKVFKWGKDVTTRSHNLMAVITVNYTLNPSKISSLMSLCEDYLDLIIITEGDRYIQDINSLMTLASDSVKKKRHILIEDRRTAIEMGLDLLDEKDLLLILGKGDDRFISQALGRAKYIGDKETVFRYLKLKKEEDDEIIEVY